MQKTSIFSLLVALILTLSVNQGFAQAAPATSTPASVSEITLQDLGVENPGILPTSPFYFLKSATRGIQRFFTFDPVKKAELELDITNQQAAEIKKMKEISPERADAITKAAENYQNNVEKLKVRLETIKETSQNPNVDKLIENLVDKSVKHQQLFEELKKDFQDNADLRATLDKNQEAVSENIAKIPEKFESSKEFSERLKKNIESQFKNGIGELKAVGIINKFESKLAEQDKNELESVKDDFVKKFEEKLGKINKSEREKFLSPESLENLSSDPIDRAKIFEDIKDRLEDFDLEEKFGEAKGKILEKNIESGNVNRDGVENMINDAKDLIDEAQISVATITDEKYVAKANNAIEQANFHLLKAEESLSADQIQAAFEHAIQANSFAKMAIKNVQEAESSQEKELLSPIEEE
ncbi:hypothetical protein HZC33_02555 [Candidatus Wolfebacteria bacterium]|nr:hypothetical protein [Candidatus Wolfebacteria bacterium]